MIKKLCFVIPSLLPGGAERVMSILLNSSVKRGFDTTLVLVLSNEIHYDIDSRINVVYLQNYLRDKDLNNTSFNRIHMLRKLLKEIKPSLAISFMTTMNMYLCLSTFGLKISTIISERNDPKHECPQMLRRFIRNLIYKLANGIIFQTKTAQIQFQKSIVKKSTIISNPVKSNLPQWHFSESNRNIVAIGRLEAQKNYEMMLSAFEIFHKTYPAYSLHIYGDGSQREHLKKIICDKNLSKSIKLYGVSNDVHNQITDAAMFILTSDYEGIPNSLLECLSMGIPSIATDCPCGGVRQLIGNNQNGILSPVGNASAFANNIEQLINDKHRILSISENAKKSCLNYSEDKICNQYFNYFESFMEKIK